MTSAWPPCRTRCHEAGPLTREERREVADHAELGCAMLAGSGDELLETAAEIAFTHHERYDGTGYPRGLRATRSRSAGGSWRSPTRSTRSPPSASTGPRARSSALWRRCAPSAVASSIGTSSTRSSSGSTTAVAILAALPAAPSERTEPVTLTEDAPMTLQAAAATLSVSPAGCAAGPTRDGSPRSAPPAGTAASRSRPSAGWPTSAACAPTSAPSSRPTPRFRCSPRTLRRARPPARGRRRRRVYRDGPPGWFASDAAARTCATGSRSSAECVSGAYGGALQASER